jgi:hypothetical protein
MILFCFDLKNNRKTDWTDEGIDAVFDVYFNDKDHDNIIFLLTTSSRQELLEAVPEL